jgi:single-strand DNA-binding protein
MASFNKVVLMGNLTRDPEIRYLPKGTAVCQITLAINRTWKDQDGEKKEEVSFIDCTAWARTAEVMSQYVKKGDPLLVEGRLRQDTWDDKETGAKRSKIGVVIETMTMLGGRRDSQDGQPARRVSSGSTGAQPDAKGGASQPDAPEDDVPF